MSSLEDLNKRAPLEEIEEHIEVVRRSLNTAGNSSGGRTITEPKLDAILDILKELTVEVRRIRNEAGVSITVD